jgi:cyclophilin family peptidyl-prolyl cis-trans isomerase
MMPLYLVERSHFGCVCDLLEFIGVSHILFYGYIQELTDLGFWDDCRFFRVLPGFVVQFGINGNPDIQSKWRSANMPDDPVRTSNERGTVVFATAGPNSRTTQLFINTREQGNAFLDNQGFSPIGRVIEGSFLYRDVAMLFDSLSAKFCVSVLTFTFHF